MSIEPFTFKVGQKVEVVDEKSFKTSQVLIKKIKSTSISDGKNFLQEIEEYLVKFSNGLEKWVTVAQLALMHLTREEREKMKDKDVEFEVWDRVEVINPCLFIKCNNRNGMISKIDKKHKLYLILFQDLEEIWVSKHDLRLIKINNVRYKVGDKVKLKNKKEIIKIINSHINSKIRFTLTDQISHDFLSGMIINLIHRTLTISFISDDGIYSIKESNFGIMEEMIEGLEEDCKFKSGEIIEVRDFDFEDWIEMKFCNYFKSYNLSDGVYVSDLDGFHYYKFYARRIKNEEEMQDNYEFQIGDQVKSKYLTKLGVGEIVEIWPERKHTYVVLFEERILIIEDKESLTLIQKSKCPFNRLMMAVEDV